MQEQYFVQSGIGEDPLPQARVGVMFYSARVPASHDAESAVVAVFIQVSAWPQYELWKGQMLHISLQPSVGETHIPEYAFCRFPFPYFVKRVCQGT
jgi:hypothetical protein